MLNIAVINIMPECETYEQNIVNCFKKFPVAISWVKLKSHSYSSSNKQNLEKNYTDFFTLINKKKVAGIILTGAPVEKLEVDKITYWPEIVKIFDFCLERSLSLLGICWGGIAIGEYLGLKKEVYKKKIFGVFQAEYLNDLRTEFSSFYCPQSRYSGFEAQEIIANANKGIINPLAYSKSAGFFIFKSSDNTFTAHLGHPEYHKSRLAFEYRRDKAKKIKEVPFPPNFNPEKPVNVWKVHRYNFFKYWLNTLKYT